MTKKVMNKWEILTKNSVTFKRWDEVKHEKVLRFIEKFDFSRTAHENQYIEQSIQEWTK